MTLAAAAQAFGLVTLDGEAVAAIRCCGDYLTEHAGAIACKQCHTIIEREDIEGEWRILRIKGRVSTGVEP